MVSWNSHLITFHYLFTWWIFAQEFLLMHLYHWYDYGHHQRWSRVWWNAWGQPATSSSLPWPGKLLESCSIWRHQTHNTLGSLEDAIQSYVCGSTCEQYNEWKLLYTEVHCTRMLLMKLLVTPMPVNVWSHTIITDLSTVSMYRGKSTSGFR